MSVEHVSVGSLCSSSYLVWVATHSVVDTMPSYCGCTPTHSVCHRPPGGCAPTCQQGTRLWCGYHAKRHFAVLQRAVLVLVNSGAGEDILMSISLLRFSSYFV